MQFIISYSGFLRIEATIDELQKCLDNIRTDLTLAEFAEALGLQQHFAAPAPDSLRRPTNKVEEYPEMLEYLTHDIPGTRLVWEHDGIGSWIDKLHDRGYVYLAPICHPATTRFKPASGDDLVILDTDHKYAGPSCLNPKPLNVTYRTTIRNPEGKFYRTFDQAPVTSLYFTYSAELHNTRQKTREQRLAASAPIARRIAAHYLAIARPGSRIDVETTFPDHSGAVTIHTHSIYSPAND